MTIQYESDLTTVQSMFLDGKEVTVAGYTMPLTADASGKTSVFDAEGNLASGVIRSTAYTSGALAAVTLGANTTLTAGRTLSNSAVTLNTDTITIP